MPAKTIRTKPFLLATAGSTVDGRTIDDKALKEMASSYNPKTYAARVNIEHIRGITPDEPFNAYGDVVELSTGEVEVDFNGKSEKRLGLYGTFDLHQSAKQLNDKGQKVYPSIEIAPDFGGKGFAYLMGCALTDSPASIGTERLEFNRADPSRPTLSGDQAAALEFIEDAAAASPAADGFFKAMTDLLKGFSKPAEPEVKPQPKVDDKPADPTAAFAAVLEGFSKTLDQSFTQFAAAQAAALAATEAKVTALAATVEGTQAPGHLHRPLGTGSTAQHARTDC